MAQSIPSATFAIPHQGEYDHTQWAPMYWLLLLPALTALSVAVVQSGRPQVVWPMLIVGGILMATAFSFRFLRAVDVGQHLAIRYGPIPLFRKRIAYADIRAATPDKTSMIDGWGIHWVPGRGWTYNLWGFDCVRLDLAGGKVIRVGTDDPRGLAEFTQRRSGNLA